MNEQPASAVDRYLWERGPGFVGFSYNARGGIIALGVNGILQTLGGLTLTILGLAGLPPGTPAFLIVGPICLAVGLGLGTGAIAWARRLSKQQHPPLRQSPEATQMLMRILGHIGWTNWQRQSGHVWGGLNWSFGGHRTASQVLSPEAFRLLDAACAQALRIVACLRLEGHTRNSSLENWRPSVTTATEEAIVSVFNQVAVLERFPEGGATISKQVEANIASLSELADRLEAMQSSQSGQSDGVAVPSALHNVLEQLRMEQAARHELTSTPSEPQEHRLHQVK